uniref:Uncharacterized protein n=1 Tax=Anguilla anguilla TaxID=7936 RepID=A0A0E9RSM1_ANGAN
MLCVCAVSKVLKLSQYTNHTMPAYIRWTNQFKVYNQRQLI